MGMLWNAICKGAPEEGMDEIRVVAPDVKGKLFFDHLITASKVDARQQTADLQVPFVNKGTTNHWLVIYEHSLVKPDIPLADGTESAEAGYTDYGETFPRHALHACTFGQGDAVHP